MVNSNLRSLVNAGRIQNLFFLILLLYIAQPLIVPFIYGCFIAIILYPFCKKLESYGIKRWIAILVSLTLVSILFCGLVAVVFYQYNLFKNDLPLIFEKIKPLILTLSHWLNKTIGANFDESESFLQNVLKYSGSNMGSILTTGINITFNAFFNIIIIPIYTALILHFRHMLVGFLISASGEQNKERLHQILLKTIKSYSGYIKGMAWVYFIVGILNSIGLFILGIKYAVLFGMITAVMTIIPYFGIIISSLLPISMAWVTTGSIYSPLGVIVVFSIVQYLEAYIIYPYIDGKRVNVNILISILSVIAGGLLWGVSGMVLFLPLVAVLKIVADEIEDWRPLSILLGDKT